MAQRSSRSSSSVPQSHREGSLESGQGKNFPQRGTEAIAELKLRAMEPSHSFTILRLPIFHKFLPPPMGKGEWGFCRGGLEKNEGNLQILGLKGRGFVQVDPIFLTEPVGLITSTWHGGHRGAQAPFHGPIAKAYWNLSIPAYNLNVERRPSWRPSSVPCPYSSKTLP
ncbi:hypothetical protein HAX54_029901 [Datura stramonium]|uniref:Uncharacterized protein n=1 Tax=Datura stramonium TaxID=4076 RepID=A0ABS8SAI7_DATST|nr:hypothetical protein [Datura stramonium]